MCLICPLDSFQERPPPVPPSRQYTVMGNKKVAFPQTRILRNTFPGWLLACMFRRMLLINAKFFILVEMGQQPQQSAPGTSVTLHRGETVVVIGSSPKRGHLVVERRNHTLHVPFQYLEPRQQPQPQQQVPASLLEQQQQNQHLRNHIQRHQPVVVLQQHAGIGL